MKNLAKYTFYFIDFVSGFLVKDGEPDYVVEIRRGRRLAKNAFGTRLRIVGERNADSKHASSLLRLR